MYYLMLWTRYNNWSNPKWVTMLSGTADECATAITRDFPDLMGLMRVVAPNERLLML